MEITQTPIAGAYVIQPKVFGDERGFFLETFQAKRYAKQLGIHQDFVQDNHSRSTKGVLRGMHFQKQKPQGKLVRVVIGSVYDVIVDIRKNSPTYGQWFGTELSEENKTQLWVPPGLAHGFLVTSEYADFEYKCTDYYDPNDEGCLAWNDPTVAIQWPSIDSEYTLSSKDQNGAALNEL